VRKQSAPVTLLQTPRFEKSPRHRYRLEKVAPTLWIRSLLRLSAKLLQDYVRPRSLKLRKYVVQKIH
jgi:hypothetical protein